MKKLVIFLGKSGSGKDTQIEKLEEDFGWGVIKTGDGVRELAKTNKKIAQLLITGEFVDNNIINRIFVDKFNLAQSSDVILTNGYPREIEQVYWLEEFIKAKQVKIGMVFLLDLDDKIADVRLRQRARSDDTTQSIARRIELYNEKTSKVVDYYQKLNLLIKIDAQREIDTIYGQICENLKCLLG